MGKVFFMMLASGVAAAAGWAIAEPFSRGLVGEAWTRWEIAFSALIGAAIGGALGGISGYAQGSRIHALRGLGLGILLGAIGGYIGLQIGGGLANALFGGIFAQQGVGFGDQNIAKLTIARTLVFVPFGACIGLMYGLGSRSWPRAVQGAIGGAIGGAVGGFVFDSIATTIGAAVLAMRGQQAGEVGFLSRGVASVSMGAAIGLFTGIVEAVSKKAWIRLELGRNEGKEWIVDAPRTFLGRSETAHVPLFGDPNVMPMHACISRERGQYRLLDGGSQMGIGVNGIRVPEATLNHGDVINIGSFQLRFLLRNPRPMAVQQQPDIQRPSQPVAAPLPQKPAAFRLLALDGPMSGTRLDFGLGESVAGRESDWLNLSFDTSASRKHAAFLAGPTGVHVRDLGSTNGTIVNGVRVQEMMLRAGDTVRIGSTTFRVEQ